MSSKAIRIMHVVTTLNIGGLEILVLNLNRFIDRNLFIPMVCSLTSDGILEKEFEKIDVPVYTVAKKDRIDIILATKLRRLFKTEKIEIIHTHNITPFLYSMFGLKTGGAHELVHTVHSNVKLHKKKLIIAQRCLAKHSYRIIGDCKKVSDFLKYQQGIPFDKVITIYNGVDIQKYGKDIDVLEKRKEIGTDPDDALVICVANLLPVKNHNMLLRSFRKVVDIIPKTKLILAGDGICRGTLETLAKQLYLSDKILFLGHRQDIPELLEIADVFVLASKSEGLPLSVLEALASSKPVVVTDVGGNDEIVQNDYCGYLVSSGDENKMADRITDFLLHKEKAILFGKRGRRLVEEKFSLQKMARDYEQIYLEAIANRVI
jgi:glycosyltransferase involved in cell wall biosynthesis